MRPRKYTKRIEVYGTVAIADGVGGNISQSSLLGTSWCSIKTLSAQRIVDLGLDQNNVVIQVNLRYRSDLTYSKGQYFLYEGKKYNILRITPTGLDDIELSIVAATNDVGNA